MVCDERELDRILRTDSLTGAFTRRAFFGALEAAQAAHLADGTPATLLVLDVRSHPTVDRWLSAADAALDEAKRPGRSRMVCAG